MTLFANTTESPEPGIYYDIPMDVYRQWDAISWSDLKEATRSMEAFKDRKERSGDDDDDPDKDDTAQRTGSLMHWFLEGRPGQAFVQKPATYPSLEHPEATCKQVEPGIFTVGVGRGAARRTATVGLIEVDGGTWVKACIDGDRGLAEGCTVTQSKWIATAHFCRSWEQGMAEKGCVPVSNKEWRVAERQAGRLLALECVKKFLDGARHEVCIVWKDYTTGLLCKARLDVLTPTWQIGDWKKSARSLKWETFAATVRNYSYHGQAAMYRDGVNAMLDANKRPRPKVGLFRFMCVEELRPYTPAIYDLYDEPGSGSYDWLAAGRDLWHSLLVQVRECLESGHWPGHNNETPGGETEPSDLVVPDFIKLQVNTL